MLIVCHQMLLLTSGQAKARLVTFASRVKRGQVTSCCQGASIHRRENVWFQGMTGTVTHAAPLFIKSFSCLSSHLLRSVSAVRHWSDLPFSFSGLMSVARHEVCPSVSPDPFLPQSFFLVSTVMGTQTPGFHGSYDEMSWLHERGGWNICCATLAL